MLDLRPLGGLILFLLAIVAIVVLAILVIVAKIVYYLGLAVAVVLCIGLVACTIRQSYIKIKSLLEKKEAEKELD